MTGLHVGDHVRSHAASDPRHAAADGVVIEVHDNRLGQQIAEVAWPGDLGEVVCPDGHRVAFHLIYLAAELELIGAVS